MWGKGLIGGLIITMRNMLRPVITVQYPYERLELPPRARWAVALTHDDEGNHKCTACLTCVRVCPDHILDIDLTVSQDKTKHIDHFRYELGACMMCGLCVEACPFDAIHMSQDYELAVTDPADLMCEFLTDVDAVSPRRASAEAPGQDPERRGAPAAEPSETPEGGDGD